MDDVRDKGSNTTDPSGNGAYGAGRPSGLSTAIPAEAKQDVAQATEAEMPEAAAMVASGAAMVDSGAGKHLTSKRRCSKQELESAEPTDVVLVTAKGEERVDKQVSMHLDALDIDVQALALDDCPNAVSLGRLVIEHGYSFRWDPNGAGNGRPVAMLISPCGTRVELQVRGLVPYLPE